MHTKLNYLYRDACNYKQFKEVILSGPLDITQLTPLLKDTQFFIPSEVGLSDLQPHPYTSDDHIWHELSSLEPTTALPTISMTAASLLESFKSASANQWNEFDVIERKGLF